MMATSEVTAIQSNSTNILLIVPNDSEEPFSTVPDKL